MARARKNMNSLNDYVLDLDDDCMEEVDGIEEGSFGNDDDDRYDPYGSDDSDDSDDAEELDFSGGIRESLWENDDCDE